MFAEGPDSLELLPIDLIVQWRRCSKMADFLASYFEYHFEDRPVAAQVLSTGLNELIENLAKFSANKHDLVTISVRHFGEVIQIEATNRGRLESMAGLRAVLERIEGAHDIEELFVAQVEHSAANDLSASGLGFINLVKDYGAQLGVRIVPAAGGLCDVRVQVRLDVEEVIG